MKITLEFDVEAPVDFDEVDLLDHMTGAMSEFDEIEGASVSCRLLPSSQSRPVIYAELIAKIEKRIAWQEGLMKERQGLKLAQQMREGYISALKWAMAEAKKKA